MEREELEVQEEENLNEGTLRAIVRSILKRRARHGSQRDEEHVPEIEERTE